MRRTVSPLTPKTIQTLDMSLTTRDRGTMVVDDRWTRSIQEVDGMKKIAMLLAVVVAALVVAPLGSTAGAGTRESGDIVATATATGKFTTLTKLLKRAGLVSALQQPGPYTVFAPTDAAFKKVPKKTLKALLANKAKLKAVLLYHVVSEIGR